MSRPAEFIEHQVSPWLRLVTPVLLALIMFILQSVNTQMKNLSDAQAKAQEERTEMKEDIRANKTAIEIYHGNRMTK